MLAQEWARPHEERAGLRPAQLRADNETTGGRGKPNAPAADFTGFNIRRALNGSWGVLSL